MRSKLLIIVFALLTGVQLSAQDKLSVSMGVVGGGDLSIITNSAYSNVNFNDMRTGYNAGIALNFRFVKRKATSTAKTGVLAFQPEVRYATMGGMIENLGLNLEYVMVPVMFQIYPFKNFYIEAGPQMAFLMSNSPNVIELESSQVSLANIEDQDLMLGAGLGFRFGAFNLGARYSIGFHDYASNLKCRNMMLQVNMGILFRFKKKNIVVDVDQ